MLHALGGIKRKVAIYVRVSTEDQRKDGFSLQAQKRQLLSLIDSNSNFELYKVYEEVGSGGDLNRPVLKELLSDMEESKFDVVLVWKIDRLSRSLQNLLSVFQKCSEKNVVFMSAQENLDFSGPMGQLIFQIFGSLAQFERSLIQSRTYQGRVESARRGNYIGRKAPFGYCFFTGKKGSSLKVKQLQIYDPELPWVKKIFELYVYEHMGFESIANYLNDNSVVYDRTRRKSKWDARKVSTLLKNDIYRGVYEAVKTDEHGNKLAVDDYVTIDVPACVSSTLFNKVRYMLRSKKDKWTTTSHLLSGKIVDVSNPHCRLFVGVKRTKGGYSYRRKKFTDSAGVTYPNFEIPAKQIDEAVMFFLEDYLTNTDFFVKKYFLKQEESDERVKILMESKKSIERKLVDLDIRSDRVHEAFESGIDSIDLYATKKEAIHTKLQKLNSELDNIDKEVDFLNDIFVSALDLKEAMSKFKFNFIKMPFPQKKMLVDTLINRVSIDDNRKITVGVRCNLKDLAKIGTRVSTAKGLDQSQKQSLETKKDKSGAINRD